MCRSIKLWNFDDRAYMDTLYGHQAEALSIDLLRQERAVSVGHDHTCRVWKVADESQLIFRAHSPAMDCCRYVTGRSCIPHVAVRVSQGDHAFWVLPAARLECVCVCVDREGMGWRSLTRLV